MTEKKVQKLKHQTEMQKIHAEVSAIVKNGKCPRCGSGLRRNLTMAGWYQCEQLGALGFRKNASFPSCDWQGFTE